MASLALVPAYHAAFHMVESLRVARGDCDAFFCRFTVASWLVAALFSVAHATEAPPAPRFLSLPRWTAFLELVFAATLLVLLAVEGTRPPPVPFTTLRWDLVAPRVEKPVSHLIYSPAGDLVVTHATGVLRGWSVADGTRRTIEPGGERSAVYALGFTAGGKFVAEITTPIQPPPFQWVTAGWWEFSSSLTSGRRALDREYLVDPSGRGEPIEAASVGTWPSSALRGYSVVGRTPTKDLVVRRWPSPLLEIRSARDGSLVRTVGPVPLERIDAAEVTVARGKLSLVTRWWSYQGRPAANNGPLDSSPSLRDWLWSEQDREVHDLGALANGSRFSASGRTVANVSRGVLRVWSVPDARLLEERAVGGAPEAWAISPRGGQVALGFTDHDGFSPSRPGETVRFVGVPELE